MNDLDLNLVDQLIFDCLGNRDKLSLNALEDYLKEQKVDEYRISDLKKSILDLARKISTGEYFQHELVTNAREILSVFPKQELEVEESYKFLQVLISYNRVVQKDGKFLILQESFESLPGIFSHTCIPVEELSTYWVGENTVLPPNYKRNYNFEIDFIDNRWVIKMIDTGIILEWSCISLMDLWSKVDLPGLEEMREWGIK